ncbi:MAG: response regulator transcription factor [Thermoanaerobaculaceae bacterium]|jgi:DNA-binding NarL/FixJ family response regulator|nr:response regulator transcription factor [Thermoanaerobaculaceae bacterium]
MPVRIVLADDHRMVREGLRDLLERRTDLQVVGEAADGETAARLARELRPDIVILDVSMPRLNGIEATRRIVAECPTVKVLALSMHSDRRFVIEMLKAGASGYLLKDGAFDELVHAIESVMARAAFLSPAITDMVVKEYVAGLAGGERSAFAVLTPREREVLQLVAEGLPTKAVAARLGLSIKTVETYRQQIMDKLDLHSVAELTKYAIREGLTSL